MMLKKNKNYWVLLGSLSVLCLVLTLFVAVYSFIFKSQEKTLGVSAGFVDLQIPGRLNNPTRMDIAPDGRIFIAEQAGIVKIVKNNQLLSTPFLTLTSKVITGSETGLVGIAVDPNFKTNGFVYVNYTTGGSGISNHNRVSRFKVSNTNPDVADPKSETILFEEDALSSLYHVSGDIHFVNGKMFISNGENKQASLAQNTTSIMGKILRLNSDGSIPTDNPFYKQSTGKGRAVYAYGFRNPFSFAVNPKTGRIFVNDVGDKHFEEINDLKVGANYGWPVYEGSSNDPNFQTPVYAYDHYADKKCAIAGGAFYSPNTYQFPADYKDGYFFSDYCSGIVSFLSLANVSSFANKTLPSGNAMQFITGLQSPIDIDVDPDGNLYYLERGPLGAQNAGEIHKVSYSTTTPPVISAQPMNISVPEGTSASFSCDASGSLPITLQWKRDGSLIPNATDKTYTIPSVSSSDNGAKFSCVATNQYGSVESNQGILSVITGNAPVAYIDSPTEGTKYYGGMVLGFSGHAVDTEDGDLPASAFTWTIDFHHQNADGTNHHTHPGMLPAAGMTSGTFAIPSLTETSPYVWFRVILTVKDSTGLTNTVYRDVYPNLVNLTFASNPIGVKVLVDSISTDTPSTVQGAVGVIRSLDVPTPQCVNSTLYTFASWSDGGAQKHDIATPVSDTIYTANFSNTGPCQKGLNGNYFNTNNFTGNPIIQVDPQINFTWNASPINGINADNFSVRWIGFITVPTSGAYTFYINTNDGGRLTINNQVVVDDMTAHWTREKSGQITLSAGQKYPIMVEYFDFSSTGIMQLSWSNTSIAKQIVPQSALSPQ